MEGRDIGSVVFPDTPYKIYIDAAEHVRAARRGDDGVVDSIAKRDAADSNRKPPRSSSPMARPFSTPPTTPSNPELKPP